MTKEEKLVLLYQEKVRLLENFILESARLVNKYHWRSDDPNDLMKLDNLSEELDKITEKIDNIIEHAG
jgi:hypothetical protein